ncbi:MAG: efflux RND transporter periplasmic adaptor subunit [Bacillota bacterium]
MTKSNINKLVVVAVLLVLVPVIGCSKEQEAETTEEKRKAVRYQEVQLKTTANNYNYSGALKAEVNSNLSFRVAGKIDEFLVEVGDHVQQGDTLAKLDKTDYRLEVNSIKSKLKQAETSVSRSKSKVAQAQSGITSVRSELYQAKNNYQRIRKLYQNDNVSKSDYDQARTAKEIAAAKLEQTKAQLTEAEDGVATAKAAAEAHQKQLELTELKLQYTDLKAPMSGVIVAKHKETGEMINASMPVVTIDSKQGLEVKVSVDEDCISQINKGDQVLVSVDAVKKENIKAEVSKIGRNQSGYQGNYPVTVKLIEELPELKAGMTAEVKFQQLNSEKKIIVEPTAVAADQEEKFVYVIKNNDDYKEVQKRRVEVGELTSAGLEIETGLETGELIVTKGVSSIANGDQVKLLN